MSVVPLPERRERLAAIDVGSNSIRLLVAEVGPHSGITVIDEVKEQPRLATGVAQTGRLDPNAMAAHRSVTAEKRNAIEDSGLISVISYNALLTGSPLQVGLHHPAGHPLFAN